MRQQISPLELNDYQNLLIKMAEGNPGGLNVLMQIFKQDPLDGILQILNLDDMNIRGTQIWVGYKDYCNSDLDKFLECIKNRDKGMVDKINEMCVNEFFEEQAVVSGASFNR